MKKPSEFLKVAVTAAKRAGKLLMASYGKLKNSDISIKSKNDFVTTLDKRAEELIIDTIKEHFPDHSIQAEESGLSTGSSVCWVIDPLDGTANYIHQFPMFSISIGVMEGESLVTGVIFDPLHRELFSAEKGKGATLNRRPIHVSAVKDVSDALMTTGIPFRARDRFEQYMASFQRISLASAGMRRGGSAALDLAYVACGRLDGFWEMNLSPWDVAAGALIIREAGGEVTDMWGRGDWLKNGDILASNGAIHAALKDITSRCLQPKEKRS